MKTGHAPFTLERDGVWRYDITSYLGSKRHKTIIRTSKFYSLITAATLTHTQDLTHTFKITKTLTTYSVGQSDTAQLSRKLLAIRAHESDHKLTGCKNYSAWKRTDKIPMVCEVPAKACCVDRTPHLNPLKMLITTPFTITGHYFFFDHDYYYDLKQNMIHCKPW